MAQGVAFPIEVRSEACALVVMLGSYSKAVEALRAKMGDLAPDDSTIIKWMQKLEPDTFQSLQTARKDAIATQWLDLEEMSLQALRDAIREGAISGQSLENMAGIAADKRLRLEEIVRRGGRGDGLLGMLQMMQRTEEELLGDGTKRTTTTKQLLAAEGEMP